MIVVCRLDWNIHGAARAINCLCHRWRAANWGRFVCVDDAWCCALPILLLHSPLSAEKEEQACCQGKDEEDTEDDPGDCCARKGTVALAWGLCCRR